MSKATIHLYLSEVYREVAREQRDGLEMIFMEKRILPDRPAAGISMGLRQSHYPRSAVHGQAAFASEDVA
jgi:hypothetical protein